MLLSDLRYYAARPFDFAAIAFEKASEACSWVANQICPLNEASQEFLQKMKLGNTIELTGNPTAEDIEKFFSKLNSKSGI